MTPEDPIQIRDMVSFKELFERYYTVVHRFVKGVTGDEYRTDEITQNVFIRLWLKRELIDSDKSLKNFLYVLAKHEIADYFRSENSYLNRRVSTDDIRHDVTTQEAISSAMNVLDIRHQVIEEVEKMPDKRQQIFRMSRFEGYSNEQIAENLCISKRTVEGHLNMALKTLRAKLSEFVCWIILLISFC